MGLKMYQARSADNQAVGEIHKSKLLTFWFGIFEIGKISYMATNNQASNHMHAQTDTIMTR